MAEPRRGGASPEQVKLRLHLAEKSESDDFDCENNSFGMAGKILRAAAGLVNGTGV